MHITEISLTNFRSFQTTQAIMLAPVTMLFGPNSVGKSSVLMALFYIQQILKKGQCDPQRIDALGEKHVGGFKSLVNGRDITKKMVLKLTMDKSDLIGSSYNQIVDLIGDNFDLPADSPTVDASRVSIEFNIAWSSTKETAYVACYKVWLDDRLIAELASDAGLKQPTITWIDYQHPALLTSIERLHEGGGADVFVSRLHELLNSDRNPQSVSRRDSGQDTDISFDHAAIGFKGFVGALPVLGKRIETVVDTDDPLITTRLHEILSDVVVAPLDNLLALLNESLCIGPLRLIPDALHQPNPYPQQTDWYSGSAAWDVTGKLSTVNIAELNHWLNSAETLNLGYFLRSKRVISQAAYTGGRDTSGELSALLETFGDSLSVSLSGTGVGAAGEEGNPLPEEHSVSLNALKKLLEAERNASADGSRRLVAKELHNKWILWDDRNNTEVAFSEVGVGISQLFPLVVAAVQDMQGIIACEQPELHVHPRIQVGIGDLLTQANKKSTFLIETHSEHLILRILRRIRETAESELPKGLRPVSPADVSIVYMEPGAAGVIARRIEIDSAGEFTSRWPNGFFAERREELL